jgi:hypothetical protein
VALMIRRCFGSRGSARPEAGVCGVTGLASSLRIFPKACFGGSSGAGFRHAVERCVVSEPWRAEHCGLLRRRAASCGFLARQNRAGAAGGLRSNGSAGSTLSAWLCCVVVLAVSGSAPGRDGFGLCGLHDRAAERIRLRLSGRAGFPGAAPSGGVRRFGRGMCCILSWCTGIRGSECGVTESVGTGRCGNTLEWRPRARKAGVLDFGLGRRADDSEDLEVDSGILWSNDGEGELTNTALRSFRCLRSPGEPHERSRRGQ